MTFEVASKRKNSGQPPLSFTIVICTHNRPLLLERCLQSVQQIDYPHFSVAVIDSAPNSGEAKILASRHNVSYEISLIKGLSRARNIGMRGARSDIVAYLDDDMVPHTNWLRYLADEFSNEDVVTVTGPMLPIELIGSNELKLQQALEMLPWGSQRFEVDQSSPQWFERANFGGIGDGNYAFRRKLVHQFQVFDENLGRGEIINGGEDHYALFTLLKMGLRIIYTPRAIVFHPNSPITRANRQKAIAETVAYAAYLVWRHPSQLWRVAKFFAGGLIGRERSWRYWSTRGRLSLSMYETVLAVLYGLSDFLKYLLRAMRSG